MYTTCLIYHFFVSILVFLMVLSAIGPLCMTPDWAAAAVSYIYGITILWNAILKHYTHVRSEVNQVVKA